MVRGPIEIERIFIIIIIIIILQAKEVGFWLILHGQKCPKLCSKLETGENLRILEYLEMGVAKWLNSATWNAAPTFARSPRFALDRSSPKSEHRCIVTSHAQKSLSGALWKNKNRKSAILHLVVILAIFQQFLLWRTCPRAFIRSTSNLDESHLNKMEMKNYLKDQFFRHTVWPWLALKVWLNAIKTRGSVSRTFKVQSSPKLDM